MIAVRSSEQRRALGDFVRAQRERTAPESLGLSPGSRRRTPGLRREELAQLCGLSTTWFTWIEQGRDVSVSPSALARLASSLRLGRAERAYLFDIAGKRDPDQAADDGDALIAPAVLACVETIRSPAYILDRTWTARSWNAKARHLFAGWLDAPGEHRYNLLRFIFLTPSARTLICDWEARARRVAAEFRAAYSAHFNDPILHALIAELREGSREFAQFWEQHGVLGREGGERTFNHPRDGFVRYEQVTFDLASQSDVKLTLLVAPEKIQRVGTGLSPR
ncbi:MAG: helix-turn-helix transcriptional regulator [Xanthobacteraceae bacterium]